jgi:isoprenylcysteine carboxyl methyltransferase (ICMT) family protein YpbQ
MKAQIFVNAGYLVLISLNYIFFIVFANSLAEQYEDLYTSLLQVIFLEFQGMASIVGVILILMTLYKVWNTKIMKRRNESINSSSA